MYTAPPTVIKPIVSHTQRGDDSRGCIVGLPPVPYPSPNREAGQGQLMRFVASFWPSRRSTPPGETFPFSRKQRFADLPSLFIQRALPINHATPAGTEPTRR